MRQLRSALHRIVRKISGYRPHIPERIDQDRLLADISSFFDLSGQRTNEMWRDYRAFSEEKHYAALLGEHKTLCFEEAFVIYVILSLTRPQAIVEVGTQFGKSTRRIIDIRNLLGIDARVTCFDVLDQVEHFTPDEAELVLKDITWTVREDVLDRHQTGFIYLDAHPYWLLKNVVQEVVKHSGWTLAIHDCGRGLCNPHMLVSKDDSNISSSIGVWERHVLAEVFGVRSAAGEQLDHLETATQRLRIFDTPHGLAVIMPR